MRETELNACLLKKPGPHVVLGASGGRQTSGKVTTNPSDNLLAYDDVAIEE
jgi:hypothetical protein